MEIKKYKAVLKSDSGKHTIYLSASNEFNASMLLQTTQSCPKSAILSIKEINKFPKFN
jgi:hypothetical protein